MTSEEERAQEQFREQFQLREQPEFQLEPQAPQDGQTPDQAQEHTHRHHRHDPAEGGWDPSIVKAPDSHKAHSKKKHHSRRRRRKRRKALRIVGIVVGIILALALIAAAASFFYVKKINDTIAIKDDKLVEALSDTPVGNPFYVLVMGSDLREYTADNASYMTDEEREAANAELKASSSTRSDVMILLRVDPGKSRVTMLSVPRDTPYKDPEGRTVKLNTMYERGGAAAAVKATEEVTGVSISHYAEVTGTGLEQVVDTLGGITVDVPVEIHGKTITGERVDLEAGTQRVNGVEALALANFRQMYSTNQEYNRQAGVRQVATGILNSIRSRSALEVPGLVVQLASCVKTDLTAEELADIVNKTGTSVKVYSGSAPYAGDIDPWVTDERYEAYAATGYHPWLCYVNSDGWKRVMAVVASGEDPGTIAATYAADNVHYADQPESTWSQGPVKPSE